ncbi:probable ethanolamine kinase [Tanacetum coccineum]
MRYQITILKHSMLKLTATCWLHTCIGLWVLIQAKMSPIDFDYLDYLDLRYNEYIKRDNECFALAKSHLSHSETT